MSWSEWLRPYRAAFVSRLLQMLQYRSAALAGFATQCWWGGIKVMVLAAFYAGDAARGPAGLPLQAAITYVWLSQGLLVLAPWYGDPEVAAAVRTGSIAYDRLRPVDTYSLWFVRSAGWTLARLLPRVALMACFAGLLLPALGFASWAWQPPADLPAALAFSVAMLLSLLLSTSIVMLLNVAAVAAVDARGINALSTPVVIVLSGNLLPLGLFPEAWQPVLMAQPLAGLIDIPMRLYTGQSTGGDALFSLALQAGWAVALVVVGRITLGRVMRRLDVQGG